MVGLFVAVLITTIPAVCLMDRVTGRKIGFTAALFGTVFKSFLYSLHRILWVLILAIGFGQDSPHVFSLILFVSGFGVVRYAEILEQIVLVNIFNVSLKRPSELECFLKNLAFYFGRTVLIWVLL